MDQNQTTALAIYAALLSTAGMAWQIFLWVRNHPRISVLAEVDGNGADEWIRFELRNRGGRATTVEQIMLVRYSGRLTQLFRFPNAVEYLSSYHSETIKLPVHLQPGEFWKGHCPLSPENERADHGESRKERLEAGKLFFRVKCAHTDSLISGIVRPEGWWPRM